MPRQRKPIEIAKIREVSAECHALSVKIAAFADTADDAKLPVPLEIDGGDMMKRGLVHITSWLSALEKALAVQKLSRFSRPSPAPEPVKKKKGQK